MKKILALLGAALILTGSSHNVGTAFSGTLVNVGYDLGINKIGVQYYDGLLVTGVSRENSEMTLEYEDKAAAGQETTASGEVKGQFKYKHKVGKQITGYYVDALKAGATPEQLDQYTREGRTPEETPATAESAPAAESTQPEPAAAENKE